MAFLMNSAPHQNSLSCTPLVYSYINAMFYEQYCSICITIQEKVGLVTVVFLAKLLDEWK